MVRWWSSLSDWQSRWWQVSCCSARPSPRYFIGQPVLTTLLILNSIAREMRYTAGLIARWSPPLELVPRTLWLLSPRDTPPIMKHWGSRQTVSQSFRTIQFIRLHHANTIYYLSSLIICFKCRIRAWTFRVRSVRTPLWPWTFYQYTFKPHTVSVHSFILSISCPNRL